jgi:HPr kinase/phosphorylase
MPDTIHATTVALGSVAAILRGPSGAGKSDLALRFLSAAAEWPDEDRARRLVADDRTVVAVKQGRLFASPPERLAGCLEVRGIGIVPMPYCPRAEVRLIVDLVAPAAVERLPLDAPVVDLLGITLPLRRLAPFEASAPLKLLLMMRDALVCSA